MFFHFTFVHICISLSSMIIRNCISTKVIKTLELTARIRIYRFTSSQILSHNLSLCSSNGTSKRKTGDLQSIVVLPTSKYVAQFGHDDPSLDTSLLFPPLKVFVQNEKERWVNIKIAHNRALKQWVEYFILSKIQRKRINITKLVWTI